MPTMSTGQTVKVEMGTDQKSQAVTVPDRKSQMTAAGFLVRKRRRKEGAGGGRGRRCWGRGVAGRALRSGVWRNRKMRSWQCSRQKKGIDFVSREVWLPARGGADGPRRTPGGLARGARRCGPGKCLRRKRAIDVVSRQERLSTWGPRRAPGGLQAGARRFSADNAFGEKRVFFLL